MNTSRLTLIALLLCQFALSPAQAWPWSKSPEEKLTAQVVAVIDTNKQSIFDSFHPVGTAKSVKIHDIGFKWKNNKPSDKPGDLLQVNVRYTVYWDGPIQKNGYTKIEAMFDAESERWSGKVLATSGITKDEVGYAVGFAIGTAIKEKLQE
jgi:hypothetical protein